MARGHFSSLDPTSCSSEAALDSHMAIPPGFTTAPKEQGDPVANFTAVLSALSSLAPGEFCLGLRVQG